MQEVFNEFAKLVSNGDKRVLRILDNFVVKKLHDQLEDAWRDVKQPADVQLGKFDRDTLYNLIENRGDNDEAV